MISTTSEAQEKLKMFAASGSRMITAEERNYLEVELRNHETALQALSTLWHIAYQDVNGCV